MEILFFRYDRDEPINNLDYRSESVYDENDTSRKKMATHSFSDLVIVCKEFERMKKAFEKELEELRKRYCYYFIESNLSSVKSDLSSRVYASNTLNLGGSSSYDVITNSYTVHIPQSVLNNFRF